MRFMLLMYPGPNAEWGGLPAPKAIAAMMKYNEELQKAGVLLALDGLQPSARGARVRFQGGKPVVSDGPFTEAKELIGGWAVMETRDKDEAIEWTKRFLSIVGEGESRIRPVI